MLTLKIKEPTYDWAYYTATITEGTYALVAHRSTLSSVRAALKWATKTAIKWEKEQNIPPKTYTFEWDVNDKKWRQQ